MPTKRTRIGFSRLPQISPMVLSILSEGLFAMPADASESDVAQWHYFTDRETKSTQLKTCHDLIIDEWIRHRPGTRPNFWWLHEAPEKCRRRLGGTGDPVHEFLAYAEVYALGIPERFVDAWSVEYYNGRARDVHGRKIDCEFHEGDFDGRAIDPNDPPKFESQAAYLERHGLLTPYERRQLKTGDLEPEEVVEDDLVEDEEEMENV